MTDKENKKLRIDNMGNSVRDINSDEASLKNVVDNFFLDDFAVYIEVKDTQGNYYKKKISGYLKVTALHRDNKSSSWGKVIELKDADGVLHQTLLPSEKLLLSNKEILSPLAYLGLKIYDEISIVKYLKSVEPQKRMTVVHKLGWLQLNGASCFALPNGLTIGNTNEQIVLDSSIIAPAIESKGTLKEWQDNIAIPASSSSRAVLGICLALSAPLLSLGHRNNAGFHIRGNSSSGKSIVLAIACSVIGPPDIKLTWRSTDNGLEGIALSHNDLMLALDEISQADPKTVSTSIYDLINGKQKIRANVMGSALSVQGWHILLLSTGEENLRNIAISQGKITKAGEEIRLADIPADAGCGLGVNERLPNRFTDIGKYADHIKLAVEKFYGVALIEWLKILADVDHEEIPSRLATEINDFVKEIAPNSVSQVRRVAESFALLAIVGELASKSNITGWEKGLAKEAIKRCFYAWLEEFGDGQSKEEQEIIENALNILTKRRKQFCEYEDSRVPNNHIGWMRSNNQYGLIFYVRNSSFKANFCNNRSTKEVELVLKKAGILISSNKSINPKSEGKTVKVRALMIPEEN